MTGVQILITIAVISLGTVVTRFLPFLLFPSGKPASAFVLRLQYLLPCAAIGMLVVYCLKDVNFSGIERWAPQLISVAVTAAVHLFKKNTLISIAAGTLCCMLLMQFVF